MLGRIEREVVTLELPAPLSTNKLWRPMRRGSSVSMVKTKDYLAWISEAGYMVNAQRPGMVAGKFVFHLFIPEKSRLDLDNAIKSVLDILQAQGIIENDRHCVEIRVKRANIEKMRAMVVKTKG